MVFDMDKIIKCSKCRVMACQVINNKDGVILYCSNCGMKEDHPDSEFKV